jgi:hypothetical protein
MKQHTFNAKFEIGQRIYHLTPESGVGIILNISYNVRTREIQYLIALGFNKEVWAFEQELSNEKIII